MGVRIPGFLCVCGASVAAPTCYMSLIEGQCYKDKFFAVMLSPFLLPRPCRPWQGSFTERLCHASTCPKLAAQMPAFCAFPVATARTVIPLCRGPGAAKHKFDDPHQLPLQLLLGAVCQLRE